MSPMTLTCFLVFFLNSVVGITKFSYVIDGKENIDQGHLKD